MNAVSERLRRLLQSTGPEADVLRCVTRACFAPLRRGMSRCLSPHCVAVKILCFKAAGMFQHEWFIQRANDMAHYDCAKAAKRTKYNRLIER